MESMVLLCCLSSKNLCCCEEIAEIKYSSAIGIYHHVCVEVIGLIINETY